MAATGAILGLAVAGGIGGNIQSDSRDKDLEQSLAQDAAIEQAVSDEIYQKSNELFVLNDETQKDLVALLPPIEDATLSELVVSAIPGDTEGKYTINYIYKSADSVGTYQPGETFALVTDEIAGEEALLVKRVESGESEVGTVAP